MKRCSECEFIYEDDQNLCDMDGHELVSDPKLHSFQLNATTTSNPRVRVRRLALAGVIAVLIGTLLSVGYSGLTSEYVPQTTKAPSSNVLRTPQSEPNQRSGVPDQGPTAPDQNPAVSDQSPATPGVIHPRQSLSESDQSSDTPTSPTPIPSPSPRSEKIKATPVSGSPLASSGFAPTTPVRGTVKPQPTKANHKKDSGIGRFLKKTGKILKKPFKL